MTTTLMRIWPVVAEDVPLLLALVRGLAKYECKPDAAFEVQV